MIDLQTAAVRTMRRAQWFLMSLPMVSVGLRRECGDDESEYTTTANGEARKERNPQRETKREQRKEMDGTIAQQSL